MRPRARPGHMTMAGWVAVLAAALPTGAAAQVCRIPEAVRERIPAEPAPRGPFEPLSGAATATDGLSLGFGHLHYSLDNPVVDLPPGEDDWLRRVELPLSTSPGAEPSGGISRGWVLAAGRPATPLSTRGLLETGYEELSFIVVESRPDGWLRIRVGDQPGEAGEAWTHACATREGPALLDFTPWSAWLLGDQISPLFVRPEMAAELRSEPAASTAIATISGDDALEPLEISGEWMRVRLKQPSD